VYCGCRAKYRHSINPATKILFHLFAASSCGAPPKIANAKSKSSSSAYTIGTLVTYTCNSGHNHIGDAKATKCQANKSWSKDSDHIKCLGKNATHDNSPPVRRPLLHLLPLRQSCPTPRNNSGQSDHTAKNATSSMTQI
jgi:hypothetical protein